MDYSANAANLTVTAESYSLFAANAVQSDVADYLDTISPAVMSDDLLNVMTELQGLGSPDTLSIALGSLGPESYDGLTRASYIGTSTQTMQLMSRLGTLRANRLASHGKSASLAPVRLAYNGNSTSLATLVAEKDDPSRKHGLWLQPVSTSADLNDSDGYTGFDYRLQGITLGYDQEFGENWIVGAAVGYSEADIDFNAPGVNGDISSRYLSLYGSWDKDHAYAEGVMTYGRNDYDQQRTVDVVGFRRFVQSDHDGTVLATSVAGGLMYPAGGWSLGPYAALHYARIHEDSFLETGAGGVDLRMNARDTDYLSTDLGFRALHSLNWGEDTIVTELNAAWNHDFDIDSRVMNGSFAGAPGTSFALDGRDVERNGALFGVGLSYVDQNGISAALRYHGELRQGYQANTFLGELRISF